MSALLQRILEVSDPLSVERPSVRSQEKRRRATSAFPQKTQLTCLSQSVVKFHCYFELFLGIINT